MKKSIKLIIPVLLMLILVFCDSGREVFAESGQAVSIGSVILFGGIDWRVLDIQDGKMLIISENILEHMVIDSNYNIWESSEIRAYINSEFINRNFSENEQLMISETLLINDDNLEYGTDGGDDTYDRLFLLSRAEVNKYFAGDTERIAFDGDKTALWWWLRSPGAYSFTAACVTPAGQIHPGSYVYLTVREELGIRPALWLNIN